MWDITNHIKSSGASEKLACHPWIDDLAWLWRFRWTLEFSAAHEFINLIIWVKIRLCLLDSHQKDVFVGGFRWFFWWFASSLRKDCGYPIFRGSELGGIGVGFVEANPKATLCVDRWGWVCFAHILILGSLAGSFSRWSDFQWQTEELFEAAELQGVVNRNDINEELFDLEALKTIIRESTTFNSLPSGKRT